MNRMVVTWILVFAGTLVVQSTVIHTIGIYAVVPDLVMISLFFFALRYGTIAGLFAGFIIGLLKDVYVPAVIGQHALAGSVAGFFMGIFNEKMMRTDLLIRCIILFIAFCIYDVIFCTVLLAKDLCSLTELARHLSLSTIPRAVYSLAVMLLVYLWNIFVHPSFKR